MTYIKINNLFQPDGMCDYKGLDIDKIVAGTQLYPNDENACYFQFNGSVVSHKDVKVISLTDYQTAYEKMVDSSSQPQEPTETEILNDYIVDVDYRLTLVELGLN